MRRGELCGLTWSDVDLDAAVLQVRQQATALRGQVTLGPVKTARSRRRIDLDPMTVTVLRDHRARQIEHRLTMGAGWRDHDLVFPDVDGSSLHPDKVTTAFARLVSAAGAPPLTFHGLRHSHASHMIEAGQHTKHIADRLGHASASFTLDRYGHSSADGLARAAQATAVLVWGDRPALAIVDDTDNADGQASPSVHSGSA
jgi:integrase